MIEIGDGYWIMEDSGIDSGDTKLTIDTLINEDCLNIRYFGSDDSSLSDDDLSNDYLSVGLDRLPQPFANDNESEPTGKKRDVNQLQHKLKLWMENAKKPDSESQTRKEGYKKHTSDLISIQRLPIPGVYEQQPLVAWDTDESDEDVISFFPAPQNKGLSDTFSLQDFSADLSEPHADDLELHPPSVIHRTPLICCSTCSIM